MICFSYSEVQLIVPTEDLNVYLGHEFDSIKSRAHRSIQSFVHAVSGKSDGPKTVVSSLLDYKTDRVYRHLAEVPNTLQGRLWIPEASLDQWPDTLFQSLDRGYVAIGPSVDVFNPTVLNRLKQFEYVKILVPSMWVKEFFVNFCGLNSSRIYIWAAGIDHEYWRPTVPEVFRFLTVYDKSGLQDTEERCIRGLAEKLNLELKIVKYGSYKIKSFRELLKFTRALIWAGSTESQGLAQFEAWAMNVPTLIRKARNFQDLGIGSESPYLSDQTGMATENNSITETDLENFSHKLNSFTPRDWIVTNATSEIARANLFSIFEAD